MSRILARILPQPLAARLVGWIYRATILIAGVGVLALAGLAVRDFLVVTHSHGIGVRTDSVAYLWGAENLARGLGLGRLNGLGEIKPMTHWPPFYPMVLSLFELAGIPALGGARYLGAALVGLTLVLSGWSTWRMTRSAWFTLALCALLAIAPSLWITSLDAMTEPLYVALGLAGALLLEQYLRRGRAWVFVLSALCMALALLTRYAGASLVAAAALTLLLAPVRQNGAPRPQGSPLANLVARLKLPVIYGLLSSVPMLLWMVRNEMEAGSATNRFFEFIPIPASDWERLWQTISAWVSPIQGIFAIGAGKLALILAALALFAGLSLLRRSAQGALETHAAPAETEASQPNVLLLFYSLYAVIYPLFVVFSRLAFDRLITIFEERIAFPWFLALLLLLFYAAAWLYRRAERLHLLAAAGLVALYAITFWTFSVFYRDMQSRELSNVDNAGRGLNTPQTLNSAIARQARALDDNRVIYTDNIEVLYFISGRHSFQINTLDDQALQELHIMDRDHRLTFIFFYDKDMATTLQREFPQLKVIFEAGNSAILTEE